MVIFIPIFVLLLSIVSLCTLYIIKEKKKLSCLTVKELYSNFSTHKEHYNYSRLPKSNIEEELSYLFSKSSNLLFCEKILYSKQGYLLTLSRLIDVKINTNKNTYRTKNNLVLIEQLASVIANQINLSNECKLFKQFSMLKLQYSLKQKEEKVFKILLGQKLIIELCKIERELKQISKIITKSKKARKFSPQSKQINFDALVYGIKRFNPNSGKILANFQGNLSKSAENLFNELLNAELKIKIILQYLSVMFS